MASIGFYATLKAPYLLLVLGLVAGVTYTAGLKLDRCSGQTGRKRLLWLWGGIAANILILACMKYIPALLYSIHQSQITSHISLFITIGISYYVFQAISYLADVYLKIIDPEPHFGHLLLSLAFFPKLLQGPIERSGDLLPQLKKPYVFDYDMARSGLLLFAWGLFKKVVVADRLALYVNTVYGDVHSYTGLPLILATYFYAFQIYLDFSGYTDMALGSARLFNINLTQNFNSPYLATSVADFWRRWHISFSRWILDYLFKPIQFYLRSFKTAGTAVALIATFLISGIWHGASLGFLVWGLLHGIYLAASVYYKPWQKKIHKMFGTETTLLLKIWQIVITFNLICFAWIFFRANTLSDAVYVINNLVAPAIGLQTFLMFHGASELVLVFFTMIVMLLIMGTKMYGMNIDTYLRAALPLRWVGYCGLILTILLIAVDGSKAFIYFQF